MSASDADAPYTWNDVAPRLGVTFDLMGDKGTINLDLDIFNILNKSTVLHVQESLSPSAPTDQIDDLMYPRTVRFGVRYSF